MTNKSLAILLAFLWSGVAAAQRVGHYDSTYLLGNDPTNYVELKAPDAMSGTYALTLPPDDGASGQVLKTDGAGVTSWYTIPGLTIGDSIGSATAGPIFYGGTGGTLAQTSTFAYDATNGRLGIGTATPTNPLQLVHAGTSGTAVVVQATDTSNSGNGITVQKSGTGRGILIQQTASGTGRGLEVTSSNAANTNAAVVITGTHGGYGLTATTSAGSAQNYTATFNNLSTTATQVSGGVYGSTRTAATALSAGVVGEVIGSGIGSGFFAVRNSAGTAIGLATNLGAGITISPPYSMSSGNNYGLELPAAQGAAGTTLVNDGAGALSWVVPSTDWASPGAIGSTTPNTGAFTELNSTVTKTTTGSETIDQVAVTYAPTGAADDMVSLQVSSTVSTDQSVNAITGTIVQATANQDANTGTVNGVQANIYAGNAGNSVGTLQPFVGYTEVPDNASVSSGYTGVNLTLNTGASTPVESVTGFQLGGNIQGVVNNGNLINLSPAIGGTTGINGINLGGNWGDAEGINAIAIAPQIGTQADGYAWQTLNEGPDFTTSSSYTGWSFHPTADDVTYDFSMVDGGAGITDVHRNVNTFNVHNNFTTVNSSFNGFSEGSNAGTVVGGSLTSYRANTTASVPGDAYMYAAYPNVTQRAASNQIVELTTRPDVAGSLGGKYLRICTAYSENPNVCFKAWLDVDNGSTAPSADGDTLLEVDIAEDDTADDIATAIAAELDAEVKLEASAAGAVVTIEIVANGRAGGLDTGNLDGWNWVYTQGGGGDGTLYGYTFGAGGSSGYDETHIIAFDSGGYPVSFGRVNAFTNYSIVPSTPNPSNVHTIGANFSVGDSATIADGDVIGVGGIGQVSVGDGSTVTSGGLKVGATSAGKISLMQAGTGSTMENVTSDLAASILVAGSGTFTNVTGYRAVNANFGASTPMTNYRAFYADAPAGPGASTNTWGLYAGGDFINWLGGGLKIGGTAGSTDQPTAGIALDVDGKVRLQTSDTPASSTEACAQGTVAWDTDYIYVCVATDTWKRTALATW